MRAQLSMYDWPEGRAEVDARWKDMRIRLLREGLSPPIELDRGRSYEDTWKSEDLFLGEICGLIYARRFADQLVYIGTPDYHLPACPPGYYYSVVVVRAGDTRRLTALARARHAFNQHHSQSGLACLFPLGLGQGEGHETGSHRASIIAVAEDRADYAAIDAISWQLAQRFEPATRNLKIVARTAPTPAPVLVTCKACDPDPFRRALDLSPVCLAEYEAYR